eukprot:gene19415-23248_t
MARWIRAGVSSGVLFDGAGGNIYLFCRTNLLVGGNHPQAVAQQNQVNNEIAQLQLDIIDYQQDLATSQPRSIIGLQHLIQEAQHKLGRLQTQQEYFINMTILQGFSGQVSHRTVPFWQNQPQNAVHGPDIIVHCIDVVNGFKIDLSTIPLN